MKNVATMRNFEVVAEICNIHRNPNMHIFNRISNYCIPFLETSIKMAM